MKIFSFYAFLLLVIILSSCQNDRWDVDVSDLSYDQEILRLDQAVFELDVRSEENTLLMLRDTYGEFLDIYLEEIMRVGPVDNPMTGPLLSQFTSDPNWRTLQNDIDKKHPNMDVESDNLGAALKRYSKHFNVDSLPKLVAYNSGFNVGVYPSSRWLGIGLEWYSGTELPILKQLPPEMFPQYKRDKMNPDYLCTNALKGWLMVKHQSQLNGEDMLSRIVYGGKILFVADKLLEVEEATLLNYSEAQLNWCKNHNIDVWKHLLENDLLFSLDVMQINKMVSDGPFTPGMPPESPGGVGNWLGLEMVSAFMDENDEVTLKQLMEMKNDREILKYYKP